MWTTGNTKEVTVLVVTKLIHAGTMGHDWQNELIRTYLFPAKGERTIQYGVSNVLCGNAVPYVGWLVLKNIADFVPTHVGQQTNTLPP